MAESLSLRGVLEGHAGWVTSITTPLDPNSDIILSSSRCCIGQCAINSSYSLSTCKLPHRRSIASYLNNTIPGHRDKTILVWNLTREEGNYGYPRRSLKGHSHFVQDVVISSDGQFALSGSWDGTLRLWDLHTGQTTRRFLGHSKDVLSVAFSVDNRQVQPVAPCAAIACRAKRRPQSSFGQQRLRHVVHARCMWLFICVGVYLSLYLVLLPACAQIVSGSRDKSIKLWNTIGECKYTIGEPDGHTDWVSCVRFSPVTTNPIIVSAGWDKLVKVRMLPHAKASHIHAPGLAAALMYISEV